MTHTIVETIFVLDANKNLIGFLSNNGVSPSTPFFDDLYGQELSNGAEIYEFSTWSNAITSSMLDLGNYIVFKYDNKYKLFQIMDMSKDHKEGQQTILCYCEMAGLELLTDYCEPFNIEGNVEIFFNAVLQDTNWVLGYVSPTLVTNIQQIKVESCSKVYKVIQDNISTFGNMEIEYRVEFDGNRLLGFFIDVYANGERGNLVYKRFEYGENVDGVKKKSNLYDFASAMIGVGKDNVNFKEVQWKKSAGDPADKPLGENFIVDIEANNKFNKHGKYIKGLYENNDITNGQDLLVKTWEKLQEVKEPKFDYDISLALVETEYEEIKIGDTDYIIDTDYDPPVYLEARVGKLELSFTDSSKNKCTLSNYKEVKSKIKEIQDGKTPRIGSNGNWWIDGEDTGQQAQGSNGVSVEEVVIQYSKNNSTTEVPTDGWDSSMPSYSEGYYLWVRTRVKYSNNDNYVYSTAICDQSWKVLTQTYTQYKQLLDKFTWLVKSGTSESTMVLTDKLYSLITDYVLIKAKLIELQGKVNISGSGGKVLIDDGTISLSSSDSTYVGGIDGDGISFAKLLNAASNPLLSLSVSNGTLSLKNFNSISLNGFNIDRNNNMVAGGPVKADSMAILKTDTTATYYSLGNFIGDGVTGTAQGVAYLGNAILIYGSYRFTGVTANTSMTASITFRVPFALTPFITTTINTTAPEKCFCGVTGASTTGFTLNFYRTTSADTTIYWQAIGQRG